MKKIFLLLTVFTVVFTSCEPLEDINAEVDAIESAIVGDVVFTLTDDDYDALDLSYGSFSSLDDAKADLPPFLADRYPVWGNRSSALVGFKLYIGNAFGVRSYNLDQEDYTLSGSSLLGFESTTTPGDYLADIISSNYSSPKTGDYVAASYFQYTGSAYTISPTVSLDDSFEYGTTDGDLVDISSDWESHSGSSAVGYSATSLSMTGYPGSSTNGSMTVSSSGSQDVNTSISPIITTKNVYASILVKLSSVGNGTYFFHLMEEDGSYSYSARVGAKDDGAGNILFGIGASSSSLTYGETSFNLDTTYLLVSSYNVETGVSNLHVLTEATATEPSTPETTNTGNAGNSANRIGIRQGGGGPTGMIDGLRVANTWSAIMSDDTLPDEVVGSKEAATAVYTYTGSAWEVPSSNGQYTVSDADFASMGIETFGSSTPAEDFLSAFLNIKFPYAQDGDELDVLYGYVSSSSGAQTRGNLYTFTEGSWTAYTSTINTNLQFGHDGTSWVPDNTIKYTLVRNADYEYMASQLTSAEYAGLITNLANYGDFDYNWTDAQINYALSIFLAYLDPNAAEGQKYLLSYVVYDNGENTFQKLFIKTGGQWVIN